MIDRDEFYIELGAKLRAKREATGLTQADVAEVAGISRTSLTNMEGGRQRILVDQLVLLCGKLGASPAEVIPVETPRPKRDQAKLADIPVVQSFIQSVTGGQAR